MRAEAHGPVSGIDPAFRMEASRWLEAIPVRRARRSYTGEAVAPGALGALEALAERWRPWPGVRCVVLRQAPASVFVGVVGAYGGVSHSPSALVFIGAVEAGPEAVGYTGEALVLEATALGLNTCWVAGLFRPGAAGRLVHVADSERVYAVSALGYATAEVSPRERLLFGAGHPKMRRSLEEIAPGHESWPAWAQAAVRAARIAPSAMNRQPWRFALDGASLALTHAGSDTPRTSKRLDCGIAMLHAELGAFGEGVTGCWELRGGAEVARFVPSETGDYQATAAPPPTGTRSSREIASHPQAERQMPQP